MDELIVCLDGFSPGTQESYRVGSRFEDIKNNIVALCEEKQRQNEPPPKIRLQFVAMRQNEHEIGNVRRFAADNEIDTFDLKTVNLWNWASSARNAEAVKKYVPLKARSRYEFNEEGELAITSADTVCTWWLRSAVILWNGDVSVCCYDYDGKHVVGNVFEDGGFRAIYKSEKYREFRHKIIRKNLSSCRTCQASVDVRTETSI